MKLVAFHANGRGDRSLERLVREGVLHGVLDISLQELTGRVCEGIFDAGPDRLREAGRQGVPQIAAPGGTDCIVLGPLSSLSDEHRARPVIVHNHSITMVRTAEAEMAAIGRLIADRINEARGPAEVLIPFRGFSSADRQRELFYAPEADGALVTALEATVNPLVPVARIAAHVHDRTFAEAVARAVRCLMKKEPAPGSFLA